MGVGTRLDFEATVRRALGSVQSQSLEPTPEVFTDSVDDALEQYNQSRPLERTVEEAGTGIKKLYILPTLVTGWKTEVHEVSRVEFVTSPNTDSEEITVLTRESFELAVNTAGQQTLRLGEACPSGQTLRLRYNAPHVIHATDGTLTTVPDSDASLLRTFAIAYCCEWIARRASDLANASIGSDLTDYGDISKRWAERGLTARKLVVERLGGEGPATGSAVSYSEWASLSGLSGSPRVSH